MADKKQDKHAPEEDEELQQSGAVEAPEARTADLEALEKRLDEQETRIKELEAKAAGNLDGWQRAVAEFQNYKKRVDRDRDSDKANMKSDLVRRFLPILDDLQRALKDRPPDSPWADGIELITRKFESILKAEGLTRIDAEGQPFDPTYHEAISYEAADGVESGHVIGVVQNGYMLGDTIVRPAQVRVAR